jgi:hypothetical protein
MIGSNRVFEKERGGGIVMKCQVGTARPMWYGTAHIVFE